MSDIEYVRTDRVYIDEAVLDIYKQLKKEGNSEPEQTPFDTYKDLFMFAVCLGLQSGQRAKPRKSNAGEIPARVFTEDDWAILKAVAIVETGSIEVLEHTGEIIAIAEEYAQTGVRNIKKQVLEEHGHPLWNLIDLLNSENEYLNNIDK